MSKERAVAIITGAAQGIGRRSAELLAQRGCNLALNDLRTRAETRSAAEKSGGWNRDLDSAGCSGGQFLRGGSQ
jgi:NAD(P)-dependent dehydrogenase (short-subunit alcohol dehydrogenase family)